MGIVILIVGMFYGGFKVVKNKWDRVIRSTARNLAVATAEIRAEVQRMIRETLLKASNVVALVSLGLLGGGLAGIATLILGDLIPWQMAVPAICFNLLAMGVVFTGLNADVTNPNASTSFGRSLGALLGFGLATFANGLIFGSQALAVVGAIFDCVLFPWLTFMALWPILFAMRKGIRFGEFTSDKVIDFAAGWNEMFKFMKKPDATPGAHVNWADEDDLTTNLFKTIVSYIGYMATLHLFGINVPNMHVALKVMVTGFNTYLAWKICQAEGIDVTQSKRYAALLTKLLALAFSVFAAYQIADLLFHTELVGVKTWVLARKWPLFDEKPAQWILGLSLLAATFIGWLWHPHVKTDKGLIAELPLMLYFRHAVFGLMFFLAGYSGFSLYAGYTRGGFTNNVLTAQEGLTIGMVARPAVDGKLLSPTEAKLMFSWTPVAKAYQLEARTASGEFVPFRGRIGEGIGHYETMFTQPLAAPKKGNASLENEKFFFRIVALNDNGSRLATSDEIEVDFLTFAPVPPKPVASSSASAKTPIVVVVPPPSTTIILTPPAPSAAPPARRIKAGDVRLKSFTTASR